MAHAERILIVGGGIAGLTLATALSQQGFKADLVERSPVWHTVGAGIMVQANGMRVLRALGLGAAVEQAGVVVRRWGFYDQQGEMLCEIDLEALWGDAGPCIGIARSRLQEVLLAGAASVPCRLGTSITSLIEGERRVSVSFSNGDTRDYDLVVGADGIGSVVRKLALSKVLPLYAGQMVWRSLVPARPRGLTSLQFLLGERCLFGLMPAGDGCTYGFGNITSPRFHDPPIGRLERLRARFAAFGGPVPEYLASLSRDEQIHCAPIDWLELDQWQSGRVILIGDAAHASIPMMGQGGCLAMEDAYVLAGVLREADSLEHALETYVSRRKLRVVWVQQESRAAALDTNLPLAVRNAALRERGDQMMQRRFVPLKSEV